MKEYVRENNRLFNKTINGNNYTELINIDDDFTIDTNEERLQQLTYDNGNYSDISKEIQFIEEDLERSA